MDARLAYGKGVSSHMPFTAEQELLEHELRVA